MSDSRWHVRGSRFVKQMSPGASGAEGDEDTQDAHCGDPRETSVRNTRGLKQFWILERTLW